jgi:transcription antitermination factor NusG
MPWHIARVVGHEHKAAFYLRRHGLRCFYPVEHYWQKNTRTKKWGFKIKPVFGGYVFVELLSPAERDKATQARYVAGFLGSWMESGYKLATVPDHYVTDLMDARPREYNKPGCAQFKPGQKVEIAKDFIKGVIGQFERLDDSGQAVVTVYSRGGAFTFKVAQERLQAAE